MIIKLIKFILLLIGVAIAVLAYEVYQKSETGHGRLDARVALFLTIGELTNPNPAPLSLATLSKARADGIAQAKSLSNPEIALASVEDRQIDSDGGKLGLRIYKPFETNELLPVVLFYHGGGWATMSLDSHDNVSRYIALAAKAIVVSVDWRQAPEHPFPVGLNDAFNALLWVAENAELIGADAQRIAVSGDSSGGNFAAVVAHMARDNGGPALRHQALIYPATDATDLNKRSYQYFESGYGLSKAGVETYLDLYLGEDGDRDNPLVSPLLSDKFTGLPSTSILNAEVDVLNSDSDLYQVKLQVAKIPVKRLTVRGMIHGFIVAERILPGPAKKGLDFVADNLREALYRVDETGE